MSEIIIIGGTSGIGRDADRAAAGARQSSPSKRSNSSRCLQAVLQRRQVQSRVEPDLAVAELQPPRRQALPTISITGSSMNCCNS